jgi:predicted DNA-binding transcriptional regulator AlpA
MLKRLRYPDLVEAGIVRNRVTLSNWIHHQGFPEGQLTGPNTRSWSQAEVEAWLQSRPTDLKPTPTAPGRPRKQSAELQE